MFADRASSRGLVESPDRRASLFYFDAAVPTVGFVHGTAGLNRLNAAALGDYAEARFVNRAPRIDAANGKCLTTSPQSPRLWPLALRWLA
jgi:hypothetical protein